MFEVIQAGDPGRLRVLLAGDPGLASAVSSNGETAVLAAHYRGRGDLVEILRLARPELDVFEAAALGESSQVEELLAAEPGLATAFSGDGFTALQLAAYFGHVDAVSALLGAGADLAAVSRNPMAVMPIHAACAAGRLEPARALLDAGADVNAKEHGGYTPLHLAAGNGNEPLTRLLLKAGADRGARLDDGGTPAELAADSGHAELAELLS